jgi:hypothetical protein
LFLPNSPELPNNNKSLITSSKGPIKIGHQGLVQINNMVKIKLSNSKLVF